MNFLLLGICLLFLLHVCLSTFCALLFVCNLLSILHSVRCLSATCCISVCYLLKVCLLCIFMLHVYTLCTICCISLCYLLLFTLFLLLFYILLSVCMLSVYLLCLFICLLSVNRLSSVFYLLPICNYILNVNYSQHLTNSAFNIYSLHLFICFCVTIQNNYHTLQERRLSLYIKITLPSAFNKSHILHGVNYPLNI